MSVTWYSGRFESRTKKYLKYTSKSFFSFVFKPNRQKTSTSSFKELITKSQLSAASMDISSLSFLVLSYSVYLLSNMYILTTSFKRYMSIFYWYQILLQLFWSLCVNILFRFFPISYRGYRNWFIFVTWHPGSLNGRTKKNPLCEEIIIHIYWYK